MVCMTAGVELASAIQALPSVADTTKDTILLKPKRTYFRCISQSEGKFATIAERTGKEPLPVFVWTPEGSRYFGENNTPQKRCNIVAARLNIAVRGNGGKLSGILMTTGEVNKQTVICLLNSYQSGCDRTNILFTLKPDNAKQAGEILTKLLDISKVGSSAGVITETSGESYFELGGLDDVLDKSSNAETSSSTNKRNPDDSSN